MQNDAHPSDPTSTSATPADTAGDVTESAQAAEAAGCGSCGCGAGGCGSGQARVPELDARGIDQQIRQSAIFGVLIGLAPGSGATVITEASPELVMTLIQGQFAGQYAVEGGQVDEQEWRTTFTRVA